MAQLRAFLAVDLSAELRGRVEALQASLRPRLPGLRWVRPESIHLTLKFLGAVERSRIDALCAVVASVARRIAPFSCEVEGLGVFPSTKAPRVLWIGAADRTSALGETVREIESAFEPLGFAPDTKPFRPHLTLARIKGDPARIAAVLTKTRMLEASCVLGTLAVDRITLFESRLEPSGSTYHALSRIRLG